MTEYYSFGIVWIDAVRDMWWSVGDYILGVLGLTPGGGR
jgi:hypothetical protein